MTAVASTRPSTLAAFLVRHELADYAALCRRADEDPEWFWRAVMEFHELHFFRPFDRLLDTTDGAPWARWCVGGTTNLAWNCLERPRARHDPGRAAIVWEGEDGTKRTLTQDELRSAVRAAAGALQALGCSKGDVVGLYMPMIPETVIAFLAAVSLGAIA